MDDQTYNRLYSTDEIWFAQQTNRGLTSVIDDIFKATDSIADNYATKNHTHDEYATIEDVALKADAEHDHDETYYNKSEVDDKLAALKNEIVELVSQMHAADTDKSKAATEDTPTEDTPTEKVETADDSVEEASKPSDVDSSDDGA